MRKIFLKIASLGFFVLALTSLSACTKAVPELSNLKTIAGFSLDQNSATVTSKTSIAFTVSGRCNSDFTGVQVSLDQGETWKSIAVYDSAAVINCQSSGNFSASFNVLASQIPVNITSLSNYSLRFRGEADIGYSDVLAFLINFTGKPQTGAIVAGALGSIVPSSGGNYKMAGRIQGISAGEVLTSSGNSYKMTGALSNAE